MNEEPVSFDAKKAGEMIGQSENWMKTQARAGKIPYTQVGRKMRWTPQHLNEILRAREKWPKPATTAPVAARRQPAAKDGTQLLQAKTPRRQRSAA